MKRTLYFGNPARLRKRNEQLLVQTEGLSKEASIPIEDIGFMVLDHPEITITHSLMQALWPHGIVLLSCDERHLPGGLMLPMEGHTLQSERFRLQVAASLPHKKKLWQQTIQQKIANQAGVLAHLGHESSNMLYWSKNVRSGDVDNMEARAAAYYWGKIFLPLEGFNRERYGDAPNAWLNYGYAIVRAMVARSLVEAGLHPTLGIFHKNKYNAFCLADDIMEPYRPFVDCLVYKLLQETDSDTPELNTEIKKKLLQIPTLDVLQNNQLSPMQVAIQRTASSLGRSFETGNALLLYPEFVWKD